MKELLVFAAVLFAVFQMLKTEPPVKEVVHTIEKPVLIEKEVVKEPQIIERKTEKIIVVRENPVYYRQPVSYEETYRPRAYHASYEVPVREERRETKRRETKKDDADSLCRVKSPNFFGAETQCQQWRKDHGYDY